MEAISRGQKSYTKARDRRHSRRDKYHGQFQQEAKICGLVFTPYGFVELKYDLGIYWVFPVLYYPKYLKGHKF